MRILIVLLVVLLLIAVPLAAIASVNTLFGTNMALSFVNWLSALVLIIIFGSSS